MPTYTLRNKSTKESFDVICKWNELKEMLDLDPNLVQMLTTPTIVSQVGSLLSKTDDGWKETLGRIKSGSGKDLSLIHI